MSDLKLSEKLQMLWEDMMKYVNEGVDEGTYPKEIKKNFSKITKRKLKGFKDYAEKKPDCANCKDNCCARIDGKILLTLNDVARLIDAGHKDAIESGFQGFSMLLDKYLETRDDSIFSEINVMLNDVLNNQYMPYLKKKGSRCVFLNDENKCDIYHIRPVQCRRFPYMLDYQDCMIGWDVKCPVSVDMDTENDEPEVVSDILAVENERIQDISLIMLNKDNLKNIGFSPYLDNG